MNYEITNLASDKISKYSFEALFKLKTGYKNMIWSSILTQIKKCGLCKYDNQGRLNIGKNNSIRGVILGLKLRSFEDEESDEDAAYENKPKSSTIVIVEDDVKNEEIVKVVVKEAKVDVKDIVKEVKVDVKDIENDESIESCIEGHEEVKDSDTESDSDADDYNPYDIKHYLKKNEEIEL
jgi:hypothetical protein